VVNAIKRHTAFSRKSVVVLGTGGTSRTMACAAVSNGARTTIVGRSRQKAQSIAIEFGCDVASIGDLPALKADILMNGTSVGMTGNPVRSIVPRTMLRRGMIVLDAVYSPEITPLLLEARKAGATLVTGRELFERQAELQSREFLTLLQ
jgi:shikimate 5-dehydrogenase